MFLKRVAVIFAAVVIAVCAFTALDAQTVCADTPPEIDGDYNGDTTVDIRDLVYLKKYLISLQQNSSVDYDVIDANTDVRHISASDLVALRKYLTGDMTAFDVLNNGYIIIVF